MSAQTTSPPLRFGVEIEAFFVPKQSMALEKLGEFAKFLVEGYPHQPGVYIRKNKIIGGNPTNNTYSKWQLMSDGSLGTKKDGQSWPLEVISPILNFDASGNWRETIRQMFAHLEAKCTINTNKRCGFHVHMSPGNGSMWTLPELKGICFAIIHFESAILAILPASRRNNFHLQSALYSFARDTPNEDTYSREMC